MKRNLALLTSPVFLVALALLLANDFIFKPLFHNTLTGKLSDFAGLFAFAIFWTAFFPRRKLLINLSIAALFMFWKSGESQTMIDLWNRLPLFDVSRVVDYTDLFAVSVLPLAYLYGGRKLTDQKSFRFAPQLFALVALFAFAATSPAPGPRWIDYKRTYTFKMNRAQLTERLGMIDLERVDKLERAANADPNLPDGYNVSLKFKFCQDDNVRARIQIGNDGGGNGTLFLENISYECVDNARLEEKDFMLRVFESRVIERIDRLDPNQPANVPANTMPPLNANSPPREQR